jgi:adenylate cyclase
MYLLAQGPAPADTWRKLLPPDEPVVLGRESAGWCAPWEPFLARRHAELTVRDGKLAVRKLPGAANPIYCAGAEGAAFEVRAGGSFVIGRTTFTLAEGDRAPASPSDDRPLLEARTVAHHELDRLAFRDAPHRLDVLSRLPEVIGSATDDGDLFRRLVDMLLAGIRRADAVALVVLPADGRMTVLHWDRRLSGEGDFAPSRRLARAAVAEQKQTVLHVWGEAPGGAGEPDQYTLQGKFDWAFCAPIYCDSCPGWALYVAGRFGGAAATLLAPWESNELRDDVKFAELVADIFGSLRQVQVLRERQGVFRRFFSPGVMTVLAGADAPRALEPRETDVTVLFGDLRGFSRRVEEAGGQLLEVLNRVSAALGLMTRSILENRGAIADFLGDAAMGFWGWPLEQPGKAEDACRAALGIRAAFEALGRDPAHPLSEFRVGIGIATGRAVAGGIGTAEQAKVTVFGPVVNLASRLQEMTKLLRVPILIDEATAEIVRGRLPRAVGRIRRMAQVRPYGLETPLMVTELIPPAPPPGAEQTDGTLSDADLDAYDKALDAFLAGDWTAAYKHLHRVPPDDRGKDVLTEFILKNNRTPPPAWDGVIPLASKG